MNDPIERQTVFAPTRVAIACQGGGSHAAYVAGVLKPLLRKFSGPPTRDSLQLVALSGTSGGAIDATLAWWGLLLGGPQRADELLDLFWESNSAQQYGETLWDAAAMSTLDLQPCEMQWSPEGPPLRDFVRACTRFWPQVAGYFGDWIRPNFFRLDDAVGGVLDLETGVDFEQTADAIGKLCSVPEAIQRWQARAFEEHLGRLGDALPGRLPFACTAAQGFAEIVADIDGARRELQSVARRFPDGWLAAALGEFDDQAYEAFKRTRPTSYDMGLAPLAALEADVLQAVYARLPRLILGAVDIDSGKFEAFRSDRVAKRGGISIAAVLASAALPTLFRPVKAYGEDAQAHRYWDGLFSQNPPIKTFTSPPGETQGAGESKPHEIWIAQVNPRRNGCRGNGGDGTGRFDIFDRRNELSGNLSLFQETAFIDAINRRLPQGKRLDDDQRIQVLTIPLDDCAATARAGRSLNLSSKLSRQRDLKQALVEHGETQAVAFLPVREFIVGCFNQRQPATRAAYAGAHRHLDELTQAVDRLHAAFPDDFFVFVEDMTIAEQRSDAPACAEAMDWNVVLRWRATAMHSDANGPDYRVVYTATITGEAHLAVVGGQLLDGKLERVRVDKVRVEEVPVDPGKPAAIPAPLIAAAAPVGLPDLAATLPDPGAAEHHPELPAPRPKEDEPA